jgi:mannose-6-phosphate isomerase-like protein (cupin superfamily)
MSTVYGKVWGKTWPIVQNPIVEFHRIEAKAGYKCSIHKHAHKWNGFFVESGELEVHVRRNSYNLTDVTVLTPGQFTMVKPGEFHWFIATKDCVAFELYWPELLSEDIQRETVGGQK